MLWFYALVLCSGFMLWFYVLVLWIASTVEIALFIFNHFYGFFKTGAFN